MKIKTSIYLVIFFLLNISGLFGQNNTDQINIVPEPLIFYATQSGKLALDSASGGGNPFATALIQSLQDHSLPIIELSDYLSSTTSTLSNGFQIPDCPSEIILPNFKLSKAAPFEIRVALVIVISDYSESEAPSLPGARHDAERIAQALQQAGFETVLVINSTAEEFKDTLKEFSEYSRTADVALIYSTGHGVESNGAVRLLFGNFPLKEGASVLETHAIRIDEIAQSSRAYMANLIFFGGCREYFFTD